MLIRAPALESLCAVMGCGGFAGWPCPTGTFWAGLALVIGRSRACRRRGEEVACQWPGKPERPAPRHCHPALLQVLDAPDGHGDRLVVDPGQQVVQRSVVLPGRPVPDAGRGVGAIAPPDGHAVGDRLGPAVPGGEPLAGWDAGSAPETTRPCLWRLGSRADAAWPAAAWDPAASSAHSPSVMPNRDSTTRCGRSWMTCTGPRRATPPAVSQARSRSPGPAALTRVISIIGALIQG